MFKRDWSTLPRDKATTMLRIYEIFGWPPGLLTLHRQLMARRLRKFRLVWLARLQRASHRSRSASQSGSRIGHA